MLFSVTSKKSDRLFSRQMRSDFSEKVNYSPYDPRVSENERFFLSTKVHLLKEVSCRKTNRTVSFMNYKVLQDWRLKPYPPVANPRQMFRPTMPLEEPRERPPSLHLWLVWGSCTEHMLSRGYGELHGVKQHAITTWTRFIVLMTRKLSVVSFQKPHQNRFSRLSRVRVSFLMHRGINWIRCWWNILTFH